MVKITIFQDHYQRLTGFECNDHAGYAEEGSDIVCAAVSALVINCINSIETLTDAYFEAGSDEETAVINFKLIDVENGYAQLLLQSLVLGLEQTESNYEEYIDVIFEEV